jgi:hypothetical protein
MRTLSREAGACVVQLDAVTLEEGEEEGEEEEVEEEPLEELTAMQAVIKECGQTEDSVPTLKQLLLDMGITQVRNLYTTWATDTG